MFDVEVVQFTQCVYCDRCNDFDDFVLSVHLSFDWGITFYGVVSIKDHRGCHKVERIPQNKIVKTAGYYKKEGAGV